jgi:hypothetical protein
MKQISPTFYSRPFLKKQALEILSFRVEIDTFMMSSMMAGIICSICILPIVCGTHWEKWKSDCAQCLFGSTDHHLHIFLGGQLPVIVDIFYYLT